MRLIDAENFEVLSWKATDNQDYNDGFDDGVAFVIEKIDNAPTIGVMPVIHGRWVCEDDDPMMMPCSVCGYYVFRYNSTPYCPNCDARMDEKWRGNNAVD